MFHFLERGEGGSEILPKLIAITVTYRYRVLDYGIVVSASILLSSTLFLQS